MFITSKMLREAGACAGQLYHFDTLFPDGVACTAALCVAHATEFDWNWAARKLLPRAGRAEFKRVVAAAEAKYQRVAASAYDEYGRCAPRTSSARVAAAAWAKYRHLAVSAYAEYIRSQAAAFGRLAEAIE